MGVGVAFGVGVGVAFGVGVGVGVAAWPSVRVTLSMYMSVLVGFEPRMMYTMPLPLVLLPAVTVNVFERYTPGLRYETLLPYRSRVLVLQSPIFATTVQALVTFKS